MKKLVGIGLFLGLVVALGTPAANAQRRSGELTDAKKAEVTLIRVDEKIARDVYLTLAGIWGVPIFSNIASSEQNHMTAVKNLIIKYGPTDPVDEGKIGVFPAGEFQDLYNDLIALGSQSIEDAYTVGVMIEKMDIADLTNASEVSQKADIDKVFTNLRNGSLSHLAAFESHLPAQD